MFGRMNVTPVLDLGNEASERSCSADAAVACLVEAAERPTIQKWIQFPKALLVFATAGNDPESGAFYVYDRRLKRWYWIDFEDEKFGGYNLGDFDRVVRECHLLDLVERPHLLSGTQVWMLTPGLPPRRLGRAIPSQKVLPVVPIR